MARSLQVDLQLNIDNAKRQLNQFSQDAQKAFKSGGQGSSQYQQAAQQAAQQRVVYRDALAQQSAFNKALQDEAKFRQQNMQAAQRANQQRSQNYSPAAQTLAGALPGGNILGSGLSGGGMAALAAASVVAAGIAAVGAEFNKLGDRARELASTSSNAASQLGQLRSSMERNSISTDINATSPGVVGFQKFTSDLGTNLGDAIAHATSSAPDRAKALQEKLAGGLGQGNEDFRRLKEQGVDMQTDIGRAQTAMQVKYQRQARDFDLEQRKFQVDTENQKFDLQKQASRQQFDQTIAIQKYQENFANTQSQKAYDLSRQFATQSFQISQGRAVQDYSISRGDKQADFTRSKADQTFDYNLNKSRSMEDRNIQLQSMALSGASGLDYFQAARSFNLQQSRAAQDFQISQSRETRDYGISTSRDARNFGLSQQRAGQDFSQQTKEAQASRQLELEAQDYARKYEGLELQTQINRQSQDLAISFQRLNQSIGFQKEGMANQRSDAAYDKKLDYSNFALQTGRQNRNYGYALADFAGSARAKDPLGAAGLGSRDAGFAQALGVNAQQSGQTDLFKQVNAANNASNSSPGAMVGDMVQHSQVAFNWDNLLKAWGQLQNGAKAVDAINKAKQGKDSSSPTVSTGDKSYTFNAGMSGADQQQIQAIVDQGDADTQDKIMDFLRRTYGG
jgi:hypothetical protein